MNILFILILIPLLASIVISFLKDENTIKKISLNTTIFVFFLSLYTYYVYDTFSIKLQFSFKLPWIDYLNIDWVQGVDA
jgi:NADH:ubiquinone oxidoreductase subunit 4 (subunit M)